MKNKSIRPLFFFLLLLSALVVSRCNVAPNKNDEVKTNSLFPDNTYYNHADSARFVGMNTCKQCHQNIYESFINTGMGKSFGQASKSKSSANFTKPGIFDHFSNLHYRAYFQSDSMYIQEYRLKKKDTVYQRTEQVSYIIGSGQHTNSHLQNINGYVHQMPMTFYTQKQQWDLPPGFENGVNTRFTRRIGLECMSCHNGYPVFVMGSENKYKAVPGGIDCERCHGPGSIHVQQKMAGNIVDTSKQIDYSIVNPAKLPIDLQFDICQRCHLQGNAVLKNNHSFYDYKPGKKLSDYISVFLPKFKNADDEFIMASHADRLKQSACFIKSAEKTAKSKDLKPYKNAMTCITCHNPHVSVRETNPNVFNDACNSCHKPEGNSTLTCTDKRFLQAKSGKGPASFLNCVSCHMPSSGSIDIPHVTVHDHYIRKPMSKMEKEKIKTFLGLYAINEKQPDSLTKAIAYLQQYEKFEQNPAYLDSSAHWLNMDKASSEKLHTIIKLMFIKQNYNGIINLVKQKGESNLLKIWNNMNYDNKDAWACYHVAESFALLNNPAAAIPWFRQACKLAPYHPDFRVKYGNALAGNNQPAEAVNEYEAVLKEYPKQVMALTNLGYLYLTQGNASKALNTYHKALSIDPDYEPLLLNLAGLYAYQKNYKEAGNYLQKILHKNPKNVKAQNALKQIQMLY
jgi:tetratricopeptide (TPR) repeat protein